MCVETWLTLLLHWSCVRPLRSPPPNLPMSQSRRRFLWSLGLLLCGGAELWAAPARAARSGARAATANGSLAPVLAATRGLTIPRGRWSMIVGHHSAIAHGNAAVYDRAHRRRGMVNGLAYHFVIGNGIDSGDGEIEVGRRWLEQLDGGHVRDEHVNHVGIGICCVGNFEQTRPTARQIASFEALVRYLRSDVTRAPLSLKFHREIRGAQTLCPGRFFPVRTVRARLGRGTA